MFDDSTRSDTNDSVTAIGQSDARIVAGRTLRRQTLKNPISCTGVGLHSGTKVSMTLTPAPAETGIVFVRTDLRGNGARIPATWQSVKDARLCTVVGDENGATVATIEHLMAALSACGVDDLEIHINGAEVPVMDGSSAPFVFLIECAGLVEHAAPRLAWRIEQTVRVEAGLASAMLEPAASGLTVDFEIEFAAEAIGHQTCSFAVTPATFKDSIMRARTFGMVEDLPKMREMGLGLGGSLDNAVVVNGKEILNEGGLRYHNEFVRHKALDAIGDLALAGRPLIGHYTGLRSSHALNGGLLQALFSRPGAARLVEMTAADLDPQTLVDDRHALRASA